MEIQFIRVNYPGQEYEQHPQESDMRRHAARVAHRRLKDKTLHQSKAPSPFPSKPFAKAKSKAVTSSKDASKELRTEHEQDLLDSLAEVLIKRSSNQILIINDAAGNIVPKWVPFWKETISQGSKEFCQIFNCYDTVAPETIPQWILNETNFHFTASAMLQFYQVLVDPTASPPRSMFEHLVKAFAALRKELETNGPSDAALLSVCGLTAIERKFGTEESFRMHTDTLRQMIKQRGGLDKVHEHVRACIRQHTASWSADLQFIEQKAITCGPAMHYPRISLVSLQRLPVGFQRLVEGGHISTDVLNVLIRITDWYSRGKKFKNADGDVKDESATDSASDKQPLHADVFAACPIMSMPDEGDFIFQKALCQSLCHYVAWYIAPFSPLVRHALSFRSDLTEKLPKIAELQDPAEERCLFWMWEIVIDGWTVSKTFMAPPGQVMKEERERRFSKFYANGETEAILREFSWEAVGD